MHFSTLTFKSENFLSFKTIGGDGSSWNSLYYLLSFWQRMVSSMTYVKNNEHNIDLYIPRIFVAFLESRFEWANTNSDLFLRFSCFFFLKPVKFIQFITYFIYFKLKEWRDWWWSICWSRCFATNYGTYISYSSMWIWKERRKNYRSFWCEICNIWKSKWFGMFSYNYSFWLHQTFIFCLR